MALSLLVEVLMMALELLPIAQSSLHTMKQVGLKLVIYTQLELHFVQSSTTIKSMSLGVILG